MTRATAAPASGAIAEPTAPPRRAAAALIGGSLLSFVFGFCVTIYVPGADGLDEAFLGGLSLVVIWPAVMLWILFAHSTRQAWLRALVPFVVLLTLGLIGFLT
ncbi:MAG: hypothetical protein AAF772_01220 [Acidobacteriota bacterium]